MCVCVCVCVYKERKRIKLNHNPDNTCLYRRVYIGVCAFLKNAQTFTHAQRIQSGILFYKNLHAFIFALKNVQRPKVFPNK